MLMLHVALAGTLVPQVLLAMLKSPVTVTPLILTAPVPRFANVRTFAAAFVPSGCDAKLIGFGVRLTCVPVPLRFAAAGVLLALPHTCNAPFTAPTAVGVNATLTTQLA